MGAAGEFAVVHLVMGETTVDLIASQVVDHMEWQARAEGPGAPSRVIVGFLEPLRVAARGDVRRRVRELRRRAPGVRMMLLPFSSRFGMRRSARLLAPRVRRATGNVPVVFHCRGESAVEWAVALRDALGGAAIVADIRGAYPEELLFHRGFDGPEQADDSARRIYDGAMARLHASLASADAVLSVSSGMVDWLRGEGVPDDRLSCVPCCVPGLRFSAADRAAVRAELGLDDRLVLVYSGTLASYQHIADGLLPFVAAARRSSPRAHLLCLTNEPERFRELAARAGLSEGVTVMRVTQSEVPRYLSAGDAGLLLRASSRMNRVSMPVKLGEYLSCGLPIVVSRVAGWVDEFVGDAGAGVVVDWFGVGDAARETEAARACRAIADDGDAMRTRALALCERRFLWSGYTDRVRDAYARALRRAESRKGSASGA